MSVDLRWAWIAGVVEGEGSFTIDVSHGRKYPKLQVKMTDADVICRVWEWAGIGHLSDRADDRGGRHTYTWRVRAQGDLRLAVDRMWPYLGERRRRRCLELQIAPERAIMGAP